MTLFTFLLIIHITGGGISLLLGSYILAVKKGDRRHRLLGNIYFYAMLTAAVVSFPMSYIHPNYFLFIIGVFTSYMLLSGKRYLHKKKPSDVTSTDYFITIAMLIAGLAFIVFGSYHIWNGNLFGIVFLVFGSIGLLFVYQDNRNFKGGSGIKNYWLTTHIQRMMGSYIASATAFIVVNNTLLPGIVAWLLPTVIIAPLISYWTRKYSVPLKSRED